MSVCGRGGFIFLLPGGKQLKDARWCFVVNGIN